MCIRDSSYIALGHIHKPRVLAEKKMAYCGSPEPLDMTETGPHGFYTGEIHPVTKKVTNLTFVPMAQIQYIPLAVNVTKETTNMELASRIAQEIKGRGEHNIYRFRLKGMRDPEIDFDLEQLASHYRICEILDDSEPQYDFSALFAEHPSDMIGFFIPVSYTHLDVYKRQDHSGPQPRSAPKVRSAGVCGSRRYRRKWWWRRRPWASPRSR